MKWSNCVKPQYMTFSTNGKLWVPHHMILTPITSIHLYFSRTLLLLMFPYCSILSEFPLDKSISKRVIILHSIVCTEFFEFGLLFAKSLLWGLAGFFLHLFQQIFQYFLFFFVNEVLLITWSFLFNCWLCKVCWLELS